jgi:RNA polymerase sigma factor (TIGR02999 family)
MTVQDPATGERNPVQGGADTLFNATYRELRQLARARLRAGGRNTLLDTTVLVHETYEKMIKAGDVRFPDRARFLVYAGRVMRSIIVDFARQRQSERRGGGADHVTFTAQIADGSAAPEAQILRVHEALEELARVDERMAKVVEMRYFGGLTEAEIAEALGVTDRTVRRDWEQARLLLAEALK